VQGLIKILNKEGNGFSVLATLINGKPWHSWFLERLMLLKISEGGL